MQKAAPLIKLLAAFFAANKELSC